MLPTFQNLRRRNIIKTNYYPIYRKHLKQLDVLWDCEASQDVWCQSTRRIQKLSLISLTFLNTFTSILSYLNKEELAEFAYTVNLIWDRRNESVYQHKFLHPNSLILKAKYDLQLLHSLHASSFSNNKPQNLNTQVIGWKIPPKDIYKVNWDDSFDNSKMKIGVGVVIRNHDANVLGALHATWPLTNTPFVVESLALLIAIQFYKDTRFSKDWSEGDMLVQDDTLQVVNLMHQKARDWSEGDMLVHDARILINSFANQSFQHVTRECNIVVHYLAKAALLRDTDVIDLESYPQCIVDAMRQDTTT